MRKFAKDLTYPPNTLVQDPEACAQIIEEAVAVDDGTYFGVLTIFLQMAEGSQLWVHKDVSDDLQAADLNPDEIKFEDVEWPENRLEVYFEDPDIPSFLAAKFTHEENKAALHRLVHRPVQTSDQHAPQDDETWLLIQTEDHDGKRASLISRPHEVDVFASEGTLPEDAAVNGEESAEIKKDELAGLDESGELSEMQSLAVLLFKVLLLASSEGHGARRTREKPTKKQGGKPGFKNRPATDRLIVEYLPRHFAERKAAANEAETGRAFRGRRGHWRRFTSPRFVNMRGKKKFIYPIPGPDGTVPRKKFILKKGRADE